jgi:iron complex transport system substrate-binding protein
LFEIDSNNKVKTRILLIALIAPFITDCIYAQERIITAGSALIETVCALGDCDKIIASDRTSLYPPQIQSLPSIGYRSSINAEGIISLKPTLIIAEKEYVEDAVLSQLSSTNIKLVIVDRQNNVVDTKAFIAQIATALHREEEGQKLIQHLEEEFVAAKALLENVSSKPRILCIYNRGTATVSMAGKDTFADILKYVGAANAVNGVERYKPLNTEALIAANPDYLLMLSTGFQSLGGIEGVLKIPGLAQTTAGKKKQIITLDSLMLTNFGPRLGIAVKELVMLLHPELARK